jgi:hypothetical protein
MGTDLAGALMARSRSEPGGDGWLYGQVGFAPARPVT